MSGETILVVDDESSIVALVRLYLEREGFKVVVAEDGDAALQLAYSQQPALIVLDVMLPKTDGFEVCRRLSANNHPAAVLMLTARDDDIDKILGLELGADDYMIKPFNPRELVARVKAILRRKDRAKCETGVLQFGDLTADIEKHEIRCNNQLLDLRSQEFEVLLVLIRNNGLVLSREKLLNLAWGYDYYGQTRTVDVHIAQLRKKLGASKVRIETITGVGYKLVT
ncbi:MAG TPA: response regulator transcription factor [Anaerolineaceae bacterium]